MFFMFSGGTEFCRILKSIDIKGSISKSWVKWMLVTVENLITCSKMREKMLK